MRVIFVGKRRRRRMVRSSLITPTQPTVTEEVWDDIGLWDDNEIWNG